MDRKNGCSLFESMKMGNIAIRPFGGQYETEGMLCKKIEQVIGSTSGDI